MAKAKSSTTSVKMHKTKTKVRRKGCVSKKKSSKNKNSKNYKKQYRGQGR